MCVRITNFVRELPAHPPVAWERAHPGFYGVRRDKREEFRVPGDFRDELVYVQVEKERPARVQVF